MVENDSIRLSMVNFTKSQYYFESMSSEPSGYVFRDTPTEQTYKTLHSENKPLIPLRWMHFWNPKYFSESEKY